MITMNDIFSIQKLYPHQGKVKSHFGNHYDSVFISFLSFVKMNSEAQSTQLMKQILATHLFEGFFCDKNTEHPREFGKNELLSLLT